MTFVRVTPDAALPPAMIEAYQRAWDRMARPGSWWTGEERVAIARACREALECRLCRERKAALSRASFSGAHAGEERSVLPAAVVDLIHRITTDPARLSKAYYDATRAAGVSDEQYVEAVGVAVALISIDRFYEALGGAVPPLPDPIAGEPDRRRPAAVVRGDAWVPWIDPARLEPENADLFDGLPQAPNVLRALSLVPAEVRGWKSLSDVQYVPTKQMMSFTANGPLDRSQIELIAARVSAANECFY